jgi:hypothetical protein
MSIQAHLSEAYDAASIVYYDLRMLVHTAVLEYVLLDPRARVVAFKSFPNSERSLLPTFLENTRKHDPILRSEGFRSVACLTLGPSWLLLPNAHFHPDTGEHLLEQLCEYETSFHSVRHSPVAQANIHLSFALDVDLEAACRRVFAAGSVDHLLTELIPKGLRIVKASGLPLLCWVHLTYDSFTYLIYKREQLLFCNQYPMYAAEDVVYFVLRVNQALQLATDEISSLLTGNAPFTRAIATALTGYFGGAIDLDQLYELRLPPELHVASCLHLLPESLI